MNRATTQKRKKISTANFEINPDENILKGTQRKRVMTRAQLEKASKSSPVRHLRSSTKPNAKRTRRAGTTTSHFSEPFIAPRRTRKRKVTRPAQTLQKCKKIKTTHKVSPPKKATISLLAILSYTPPKEPTIIPAIIEHLSHSSDNFDITKGWWPKSHKLPKAVVYYEDLSSEEPNERPVSPEAEEFIKACFDEEFNKSHYYQPQCAPKTKPPQPSYLIATPKLLEY